jgi:hypothetical protein
MRWWRGRVAAGTAASGAFGLDGEMGANAPRLGCVGDARGGVRADGDRVDVAAEVEVLSAGAGKGILDVRAGGGERTVKRAVEGQHTRLVRGGVRKVENQAVGFVGEMVGRVDRRGAKGRDLGHHHVRVARTGPALVVGQGDAAGSARVGGDDGGRVGPTVGPVNEIRAHGRSGADNEGKGNGESALELGTHAGGHPSVIGQAPPGTGEHRYPAAGQERLNPRYSLSPDAAPGGSTGTITLKRKRRA